MAFMLRSLLSVSLILTASLVSASAAQSGPSNNQITILYDAFSAKSGVALDWGYAALVEFDGKRILFDTGNNAEKFEANIKQLHIDLTKIDLVVLSHRHGDHTSGLRYVLSLNPTVPIYAPADETFAQAFPAAFLAPATADSTLPTRMRYFDGHAPLSPLPHGTAWPSAHFSLVNKLTDITPRIHLISTISELPGFRDMPEVSLILDTPSGPIVIVGCSHPGIENVLANVVRQTNAPSIYEVIGGLHLVVSKPADVDHIVAELLTTYHVQRTALGHCTGEHTFALMQKRLGKEYLYAGVGEILPL